MTFEIAVATLALTPTSPVRPHAPGHIIRDAQRLLAGRPYPRTAVAKHRVAKAQHHLATACARPCPP
jgi:hypothetical protein